MPAAADGQELGLPTQRKTKKLRDGSRRDKSRSGGGHATKIKHRGASSSHVASHSGGGGDNADGMGSAHDHHLASGGLPALGGSGSSLLSNSGGDMRSRQSSNHRHVAGRLAGTGALPSVDQHDPRHRAAAADAHYGADGPLASASGQGAADEGRHRSSEDAHAHSSQQGGADQRWRCAGIDNAWGTVAGDHEGYVDGSAKSHAERYAFSSSLPRFPQPADASASAEGFATDAHAAGGGDHRHHMKHPRSVNVEGDGSYNHGENVGSPHGPRSWRPGMASPGQCFAGNATSNASHMPGNSAPSPETGGLEGHLGATASPSRGRSHRGAKFISGSHPGMWAVQGWTFEPSFDAAPSSPGQAPGSPWEDLDGALSATAGRAHSSASLADPRPEASRSLPSRSPPSPTLRMRSPRRSPTSQDRPRWWGARLPERPPTYQSHEALSLLRSPIRTKQQQATVAAAAADCVTPSLQGKLQAPKSSNGRVRSKAQGSSILQQAAGHAKQERNASTKDDYWPYWRSPPAADAGAAPISMKTSSSLPALVAVMDPSGGACGLSSGTTAPPPTRAAEKHPPLPIRITGGNFM